MAKEKSQTPGAIRAREKRAKDKDNKRNQTATEERRSREREQHEQPTTEIETEEMEQTEVNAGTAEGQNATLEKERNEQPVNEPPTTETHLHENEITIDGGQRDEREEMVIETQTTTGDRNVERVIQPIQRKSQTAAAIKARERRANRNTEQRNNDKDKERKRREERSREREQHEQPTTEIETEEMEQTEVNAGTAEGQNATLEKERNEQPVNEPPTTETHLHENEITIDGGQRDEREEMVIETQTTTGDRNVEIVIQPIQRKSQTAAAIKARERRANRNTEQKNNDKDKERKRREERSREREQHEQPTTEIETEEMEQTEVNAGTAEGQNATLEKERNEQPVNEPPTTETHLHENEITIDGGQRDEREEMVIETQTTTGDRNVERVIQPIQRKSQTAAAIKARERRANRNTEQRNNDKDKERKRREERSREREQHEQPTTEIETEEMEQTEVNAGTAEGQNATLEKERNEQPVNEPPTTETHLHENEITIDGGQRDEREEMVIETETTSGGGDVTDNTNGRRATMERVRDHTYEERNTLREIEVQQMDNQQMPSKIIQGTFNQGDPRFGQTAGSQCTVIAFFAALYSLLKNVSCWTSDDVDAALQHGDKLYKKVLQNGNNQNVFLSLDELPTQVKLANLTTESHVDIVDQLFILSSNPDMDKSGDLCNVIGQATQYNNAAICVIGTRTVLFLYPKIPNPPVYVFDSHSRNFEGHTSPDGSAVLMMFKDARNAITHLFKDLGTQWETHAQVGFPEFLFPDLNIWEKRTIIRQLAAEEQHQARLEEQVHQQVNREHAIEEHFNNGTADGRNATTEREREATTDNQSTTDVRQETARDATQVEETAPFIHVRPRRAGPRRKETLQQYENRLVREREKQALRRRQQHNQAQNTEPTQVNQERATEEHIDSGIADGRNATMEREREAPADEQPTTEIRQGTSRDAEQVEETSQWPNTELSSNEHLNRPSVGIVLPPDTEIEAPTCNPVAENQEGGSNVQLGRRRVGPRQNETLNEYETRLARDRERQASRRRRNQETNETEQTGTETLDEYERRLALEHQRRIASRNNETLLQQLHRRTADQARVATRRAAESSEQERARMDQNAVRQAERRSNGGRKWSGRPGKEGSIIQFREAFSYDANKEYTKDRGVVIGEMSVICPHCRAKRFPKEAPSICCENGKIVLEPLQSPAEPLATLLSGQTERSRRLLNAIRKYNSIFTMTSFRADTRVRVPGFQPTFTIGGQIYHVIGDLHPRPNVAPQFVQLYFLPDMEDQCDRRCAIINGLDRTIVLELQHLLHDQNSLVRRFKTAMENQEAEDFRIIVHGDRAPAGEHPGRYNGPHNEDIAALVVGDRPDSLRDIVLQYRNGGFQNINELNQFYDSFQYPLMFWNGQGGYHIKIPHTNTTTGEYVTTKKVVSCNEFYAHRLMIRDGEDNHILHYRELFHQFLTDMYVKTETTRLKYVRNNQSQLRVEQYGGLKDAIAGDMDAGRIGNVVVLPSSHTGGPRYMAERQQDTMCYVKEFGKPCLFVTMTCNPKWPEIQALLDPIRREESKHRHDVTARVFHQKVQTLVDLIVKGQIFGRVQAYIYTIEWQKRGLPHVHMLFWFVNKILPNEVDHIISAEIPDEKTDEKLFATVTKNLIHGPCGSRNSTSPCMKDGKCSKRYPKEFISETRTDTNGFPLYRRRSPDAGGNTAEISIRKQDGTTETHLIDNRDVVPYCPLLCKIFDAHVNVESCVTIHCVSYLTSYINKGSDMQVFQIIQQQHSEGIHDEILAHQTARHVSSNEAVWRLLNFPIHERHPAVIQLSVHLVDGMRVVFREDNAEDIADAPPPSTTLTEFFHLCQSDSFAATLLYSDVPKFYVWTTKPQKKWSRRKQGTPVEGHPGIKKSETIGRVYAVHPKNFECYFLRMLLHTVPGPTSYEALRTIDGVICLSFREACLRLGLLEDDAHWHNALAEASLLEKPRRLRTLFAIMLAHCEISNPAALWEAHKNAMADDYLRGCQRRLPNLTITMNDSILKQALIFIENKVLYLGGKRLHEYQLPLVNRDGDDDPVSTLLMRETSYNEEELRMTVLQSEPTLTEEQTEAYEEILSAVQHQAGKLFFLDAPGGTGKTFLLNLLLANIRRDHAIAIAVASSGIAATLLDGGRTAHSTLKLPLHLERGDTPMCNIPPTSESGLLLQQAKLIVWDESTMTNKRAFEALDRTLRDVRNNDSLNGGLTVLLAGDFRQTLPIVPRGTRADAVDACLKSSILWSQAKKLKLTVNMRARLFGDTEAQEFSRQLLAIGEGRLDTEGDLDVVPCGIFVQNVEELIDAVFPDIVTNLPDTAWLSERAILCPKNDSVNNINQAILDMLPGDSTLYRSVDKMKSDDEALRFPVEYLNSLNPPGLPQHKLFLKVGVPVILTRNLDAPRLCNGTRLVIRALHKNVVDAEILTGRFAGERVFIPRMPLDNDDSMAFTFCRLQFPLRLCFAITINKSQGQTMKVVGINLLNHCFSHGQLYVACSRVGSAQNIFIFSQTPGLTRNVVYPEAIQD